MSIISIIVIMISIISIIIVKEKMRKASLRDRQLVWWTGAQPWEKQ